MRTNRITQGWNANEACVYNRKIVACRPGLQSYYQAIGLKGHNGLDLALWHGEHLYFSTNLGIKWRADRIGAADERGLHLSVISDEKMVVEKQGVKVLHIRKPREGEEGTYIKFIFGHLIETPYQDGDTIRFGQYLGRGDNTGISTGDHLHFGFKECEKNGNGLNKDNGYYGALDFTPLYSGRYVVDVDKEITEMKLTMIELLKKYRKLLQLQIRSVLKK